MRGAWIEISLFNRDKKEIESLPMRGAWIEIFLTLNPEDAEKRRSPCGERGLKCFCLIRSPFVMTSLPMRGAWIEMFSFHPISNNCSKSLPMRGAWIEIYQLLLLPRPPFVAPHAGSVD